MKTQSFDPELQELVENLSPSDRVKFADVCQRWADSLRAEAENNDPGLDPELARIIRNLTNADVARLATIYTRWTRQLLHLLTKRAVAKQAGVKMAGKFRLPRNYRN